MLQACTRGNLVPRPYLDLGTRLLHKAVLGWRKTVLSIKVFLSLNHLKTRGIGGFKEPFVHQQ